MYNKVILSLCLWIATAAYGSADAVYLTWKYDPTTSMTVQWISDNSDGNNRVDYSPEHCNDWKTVFGIHYAMPLDYPNFVHRVELTDLQPNTEYAFRVSSSEKVYKFRTMPRDASKPVRFVVGGDMYHDDLDFLIETNREAARTDPSFALVGGDIAYAASKKGIDKEKGKRWIEWLNAWEEHMVRPDGCLIPMIPTLGNHDVAKGYEGTPKDAPFFYTLFDQGYHVLDFGNYMSIIALDTHHTHPIWGDQAYWLRNTLAMREHVPHTFAFYHIPAYPSVRTFNGKVSPIVRRHWVPLFEHFHLTAAFEHHDHAYKRTHPILNDKIDPKGVLYFGDGAWGVKKPRNPKKGSKAWYLANAAAARHFILVTVQGDNRSFQAIDSEGNVIDTLDQPVCLTK